MTPNELQSRKQKLNPYDPLTEYSECGAWPVGFDMGYALAEEGAKPLVKALQRIAGMCEYAKEDHRRECLRIAFTALAAYPGGLDDAK